MLKFLKNLFHKKPDYVPCYPYSDDPLIKRQQIWDNLKTGLLLEDKQIFIEWNTPFNQLYKFQEDRRDSGDRTEWYFGKHKILDGYETHLEAMKWIFKPGENPVAEIYTRFGVDGEGQKKFNFLRKYLTQLLGDPAEVQLEKWGSFDLGSIIWKNESVQVCLTAVEIFNVRYTLNIGLKNNPNNKLGTGIITKVYIWFCIKFNIDIKI